MRDALHFIMLHQIWSVHNRCIKLFLNTDWIGRTLDHGIEILKFVSNDCNMTTYL